MAVDCQKFGFQGVGEGAVVEMCDCFQVLWYLKLELRQMGQEQLPQGAVKLQRCRVSGDFLGDFVAGKGAIEFQRELIGPAGFQQQTSGEEGCEAGNFVEQEQNTLMEVEKGWL